MNIDTEAEGVWDSHVHILPPGRTRGLVRWIKRAFPGHPSREDYTPTEILSDLKSCGTSTVFNLVFPLKEDETDELNLFSRDIAEGFDGVVPFGSLHVMTPEKDRVAEQCITELGLAGIKLHPYVQGFEAFSDEFKPLYMKLNRLKRPFVVHTGFDMFYRRTQDLDYLARILDRYPDMPVVLVHSLFPRFRLADRLLREHDKLYLDMTNVLTSVKFYYDAPKNTWAKQVDGGAVSENLDFFFTLIERHSDRIMFGTDHPAGMWSPEQIYKDFNSFDFNDEIRINLLRKTARSFYLTYCAVEGSK